MIFDSLSQLQNASVAHLIAFCTPHPASHRGHDEALEIKSSVVSSPQKNLHRTALLKGLLLSPSLILELFA